MNVQNFNYTCLLSFREKKFQKRFKIFFHFNVSQCFVISLSAISLKDLPRSNTLGEPTYLYVGTARNTHKWMRVIFLHIFCIPHRDTFVATAAAATPARAFRSRMSSSIVWCYDDDDDDVSRDWKPRETRETKF